MRSISNSILNKLNSRVQAGANKLSASLWVGRPTTPLTEDKFLEKQSVFSSSNITAIDVSVCHPQVMRGATYVYVAYVENGIAKVKRAKYRENMPDHIWEDVDFAEEAVDVSICFDGTMPKAVSGTVEFVTDKEPWIFWTNSDGKLFGKKIGTNDVITLAELNCTAVSAVRAMWSSTGDFDFGFVVFFLLNGKLYYRQYFNKEWFDAEIITFGPNTTYVDIAAFRTWDYRIGVQAKTTDNKFYELFTQFMGIGKQNAEHIEVSELNVRTKETKLKYTNSLMAEHVEVTNISARSRTYLTKLPEFKNAYNVEDENGDWGTTLVVVSDVELVKEHVEKQYLQFVLTDSLNVRYIPSSAKLQEDEKTIVFYFSNFNNAREVCKFTYSPGTIQTLAGTKMGEVEFSFVPQNLVPVNIPVPEVEYVWNE